MAKGRSSKANMKGKDAPVEQVDSDIEEMEVNDDKTADADDNLPKVPTSTQAIKKVMIVPKAIRESNSWGNIQEAQIKHPRTQIEALFLIEKGDNAKVYEVLTMQEETRSWFFNNNVISDGCTYVCTPVDPLFILLPILTKSDKAKPLNDHLFESELPKNVADILSKSLSTEQLENIAIKKGSDDIVAFVYSETKTLAWLKSRVEKVSKFLHMKEISITETSVSSNFVTSVSDKDCLRYACNIVGEYLDKSLRGKLFKEFNLPEISEKRKSEVELGNSAKKTKSGDNDGVPSEDYGSTGYSPALNKNVKVTAKEKGLQKAAQGSHSLFKFFTPKGK